MKSFLRLVLDSASQNADSLRVFDLDSKDMVWAVPKDPTIERECVRHERLNNEMDQAFVASSWLFSVSWRSIDQISFYSPYPFCLLVEVLRAQIRVGLSSLVSSTQELRQRASVVVIVIVAISSSSSSSSSSALSLRTV